MPWRLIGFIVLFGLVLAFIGFNLENASIISFGFIVSKKPVPVYFIVFASFILGLLAAVPSIVSSKLKKKGKPKESEKPPAPKKKGKDDIEELPSGEGYGID
jgi:uncharacterized integral membrane protein